MFQRKIVIVFLSCFLFVCTLFIISKGTLANGVFSKSFAENTYVGPFDLSRQNNKEAETNLASNLSELYTIFSIDLTLQDFSTSLPHETVEYNLVYTLENVKSGEENPILASVSLEGLQTVLDQQFPSVSFSDESVKSIAQGIEKELESGFMPLNVHIIDFMNPADLNETSFAPATINFSDPSPALLELIGKLNGYRIDPSTSFSMLEFIETSGAGLLNDQELTQLASVLYATILQTNFQVDERTISSTLPATIQPGFEAAINKSVGLDFVFTNVNRTPFTINVGYTDASLKTSLTGVELLYSYDPFVGKMEEYAPKTVRKFSSFVSTGQVTIADEGIDGIDVELLRTISYEGSLLVKETVSSDFYAPIPRVEIHSLVADQTPTTDTTGTPDIDNGSDSSLGDIDSNEPSTGETSTQSPTGQGSSKPNQTEQPGNENGLPTDGNGKIIEYDKGGNVIE